MQPTFLIVDDVPVVRSVLRRAIGRIQPYAVIAEAATVEEAITALDNVRISAVITDYHLPDGHGLSVLRAARQQNAAVPVLVMSADNDVADRALAAGATRFFTKPLDVRQFITVMEQLC